MLKKKLTLVAIPSPIGELALGFNEQFHLALLKFIQQDNFLLNQQLEKKYKITQLSPFHSDISNVIRQLEEYFNGARKEFSLTLDMCGTDFQMQVWKKLLDIPYGKTWSYSELAEAIGNKRGYRAVGQGLNKNPIAIVIPCHRVIGKSGGLTGFAGGIETKKWLLTHESANC